MYVWGENTPDPGKNIPDTYFISSKQLYVTSEALWLLQGHIIWEYPGEVHEEMNKQSGICTHSWLRA